MSDLYPGFDGRMIDGDGARLFVRTGGSGPALLLLHGFPQTGAIWHKIAGELSQHFSLVIPDLRGYGRSDKPANDAENLAYSKRAMANDLLQVMRSLGHEDFHLCGHDRGGRVAYRLAQDHPHAVTSLITLDIVPTLEQWKAMASIAGAMNTYHWPFLAQPYPMPERMIGADPDFYIDQKLGAWNNGTGLDVFDPAALAEYRSYFRDPAVIHALCNDYRAGATCDVDHDLAALDQGIKITCPMLALWGDAGIPGKSGGGPLDIWRTWATNVSGGGIACGHFLPEEAPAETLAAMLPFLMENAA
jgi:haloacetate dehalogenase